MTVDLNRLLIRYEKRIGPQLAAPLRAIYESNFPPSQREPFEHLAAAVEEGALRLLVAWLDDEPVALAITMPLEGTDVVVLSYIAVRSDLQSRGIGGRLLDHLIGLLRDEQHVSGLLFEVESVNHGPPHESAQRRRRVRFYERRGASIVACAPHYRAPDLSGPGVLYYHLMWLPLAEAAVVPVGERLRTLVQALLMQGYGLPADDPLVQDVLDDLTC